MKEQLISKINGVDIVTVEQDGEVYVPIKPICTALGIDDKAQRDKLNSDEFFVSTGGIITSVAEDGKSREMYSLPLRYVYGWLATINPGKVAPDAKEAVMNYRRKCYDVLYEHFAGGLRRQVETNEAEIALLKEINSAIGEEKEARTRRKRAEDKLDKLRAERLNPQPVLF